MQPGRLNLPDPEPHAAPNPATSRAGISSFAPDAPRSRSDAVVFGELLLRAARLLEAALAASSGDFGLNETRFSLLELLRQTPDGCSQIELAGKLFLSEANLSTLLERMRLDGLITRERSSVDRRKSLVRLTPLGNEALAKARRSRGAAISSLLGALSSPHSPRLSGTLQELVAALEGRIAEQRLGERSCRSFGVIWPDGEGATEAEED